METLEKESVTLLNDLVVMNNDRVEGYEKAAKETEDAELKALFNSMAAESRKFKTELLTKVESLNGTPATGTTASGKVYRAWMDLKAAVSKKDRKGILAACEFGEDSILQTYRDVLQSDELAPQLRASITSQQTILKKSHDKIKLLRDSA
jgi:uncharacterized protein (TIGR02284 family)